MQQFISDVIVSVGKQLMKLFGRQSCSLALRRGKKERKIPSETGLYTCPGPVFLDDGSAKLNMSERKAMLSCVKPSVKFKVISN